MERREQRYDSYFDHHRKRTLWYEDLESRRDHVLREAQAFLGVEPQPLATALKKQNPQPLWDLLANYRELRDALKHTRYAHFLE